MIAVTFSLPDESRDFVRMLSGTRRSGRGVGSFIEGSLEGVPVLVWHIGIGAHSARTQMAKLFAHCRPTLVICAGYAGALDPKLELGDIVLERIVTVPKAAETLEEKQRLEGGGAVAVDMETSIVAEACAGTPMQTIRAISDRFHDPLPLAMRHWFDLEQQRPAVAALLWHLATHPAKIAPFVRFVRGLAKPRRRLAVALGEIIPRLALTPL